MSSTSADVDHLDLASSVPLRLGGTPHPNLFPTLEEVKFLVHMAVYTCFLLQTCQDYQGALSLALTVYRIKNGRPCCLKKKVFVFAMYCAVVYCSVVLQN